MAEELNFTRAAERLRLAQPSMSRQIHNLEAEMGVRLLDRGRNQVSLTEEGRSFLVDARSLVALSLESVEAVQRFSRGESSQLNLGYLFKYNFDLLSATLATLYRMCPEVSVTCSTCHQLNSCAPWRPGRLTWALWDCAPRPR